MVAYSINISVILMLWFDILYVSFVNMDLVVYQEPLEVTRLGVREDWGDQTEWSVCLKQLLADSGFRSWLSRGFKPPLFIPWTQRQLYAPMIHSWIKEPCWGQQEATWEPPGFGWMRADAKGDWICGAWNTLCSAGGFHDMRAKL